MSVCVTDFDVHIVNTPLGVPTRYGNEEWSALPHAFVRVVLEVDGKKGYGLTADGLVPKWFTKNPQQTFRDELAEMFHVIETAGQIVIDAKPANSVFDLWQHVYVTQMQWAVGEGYPPLLWNFGVSLIERAVIDAFCRVSGISFSNALTRNVFGIRLNEIHQQLRGQQPADLLEPLPRRRIYLQQTIGLDDAMTDAGATRFKVQLRGQAAFDLQRLEQLHDMLDHRGAGDYTLILDLNEAFDDAATFREYWQEIGTHPLLKNILAIEQPICRETALSVQTQDVLQDWEDRPPMIIDESGGLLGSLQDALETGYVGSSFKSCKGIFKGIADACLLKHLGRTDPASRYIMTCEDGGSLGQGLAVIASLGFEDCAQSEAQLFKGESHWPENLQGKILGCHGDLYCQDDDGFVAMRLEGGELALDTTVDAPFGLGFEFNPSGLTPLDDWQFESLGGTS